MIIQIKLIAMGSKFTLTVYLQNVGIISHGSVFGFHSFKRLKERNLVEVCLFNNLMLRNGRWFHVMFRSWNFLPVDGAGVISFVRSVFGKCVS